MSFLSLLSEVASLRTMLSVGSPLIDFFAVTIELLSIGCPNALSSHSIGGRRIKTGAALQRERERLLKTFVQECDGSFPSNASSLSVIFKAILLEEPVFGSWIRIEGSRPPRCLELLLHLRDRLN